MASTLSVLIWGPPKPSDGPSPSGFCQKLEAFLRYSSVSYEHQAILNPGKAPKGKVPFADVTIGDKQERVSDSTFIIRHLINKDGIANPDAHLTPARRGDSRAWQAWLEELISIPCDRLRALAGRRKLRNFQSRDVRRYAVVGAYDCSSLLQEEDRGYHVGTRHREALAGGKGGDHR